DARGKLGRGLAFERALGRSLGGADAVLVHMVPTFLTLAAPLAKVRRVPLLLWYTHWHASRSLRLAARLADRVLSVDRTSFALATFLEGLPLQLLARPGDVASLAAVLRGVVNAAPAARAATGVELRRRVVEQHSLEHWADTVISLVREVRSARGG